MSLIRTALVLGVVIYALPTDPKKQQELVASASDTIVWGATYCQREPETCKQAGVALNTAVQKAKFGLALAADVASKWSEQHKTGGNKPSVASTLTINDILAAPASDAEPVAQNPADPSISG